MGAFRSAARFVLGSALPFGAAVLALAGAGPTGPERVSVGDGGAESDGNSYDGAVTGNGRFIALNSDATNLMPAAGNANEDIFVRDRKTGTNLLASRNLSGGEGNNDSRSPAISDNGRYVVFGSYATDLVAGDANFVHDIFLTDMRTGVVTRISEPPGGGDSDGHSFLYGAAISKNGRYVVYYSTASNLVSDGGGNYFIYLYDRVKGTNTLISRNPAGTPANGECDDPSISPNGRFVAYYSSASDLVAGDSPGNQDVFVYDVKKGTTRKASVGLLGAEANGSSLDPVVSNNGRWVAFFSDATNLVANDTNGHFDVFLADLDAGSTRRVSVTADGTEGSADSYSAAMSADGKVLVFYTSASNLDPGDANGTQDDIYRFDTKTGVLTLLSVNAAGVGGDGQSFLAAPSLSSNGKYLAFSSSATNLILGDANGLDDQYLIRVR